MHNVTSKLKKKPNNCTET